MIDSEQMSIVLPGRIIEFFPETQTANIKICAERIVNTIYALEELGERAELKEVPVHTPYGGGWSVTFPIKEGDTCLIFFSQVGYDHWLWSDLDKAGKVDGLPSPNLKRTFSENDPLALVGFNTVPRAITNYSPNHSQWRSLDGVQQISLNNDNSISINTDSSVVINCSEAVVSASSSASVVSPTINLDGNVGVTGNLVVGGTTSITGPLDAQGKDFLSHTHTSSGSGSPTSGVN